MLGLRVKFLVDLHKEKPRLDVILQHELDDGLVSLMLSLFDEFAVFEPISTESINADLPNNMKLLDVH
jgi:hypothetical protein